MRVLLDTHVLLWALDAPSRLKPATRELLSFGADEVVVSAVSIWEIAIKRAVGKLTTRGDVVVGMRRAGFVELPLTFEHAHAVAGLPPHHGDPFDRLLVAQAQLEALTIVTRDKRVSAYGVPTLAA